MRWLSGTPRLGDRRGRPLAPTVSAIVGLTRPPPPPPSAVPASSASARPRCLLSCLPQPRFPHPLGRAAASAAPPPLPASLSCGVPLPPRLPPPPLTAARLPQLRRPAAVAPASSASDGGAPLPPPASLSRGSPRPPPPPRVAL